MAQSPRRRRRRSTGKPPGTSNPLRKRAPKGVRKPRPAKPKPAEKPKKARPHVTLEGGGVACDRCHKERYKYQTPHGAKGWGRDRVLCESCRDTEWRENALRHSDALSREFMVMDNIRDEGSFLVERFLDQKLRAYDMPRATIYVDLRYDGQLRKNPTSVSHLLPNPKRGAGARKWRPWMEVKVGQIDQGKISWPFKTTVGVGTKKIQDEVARELMRKDWYFETVDVEFADAAEALAFAAAEGLHKVLVKLRVEKGRAVGTEARRFAVRWLEDFRVWRRGRGGAPRQTTLGLSVASPA